ncbi:hypothetical protein [Listeria seeligeri]|uniref:hypothetical protein n=1 Tax=Listeria seeligeri TaxID=1640 RepID=UPI001887C0F6|nr:hypothetical protein [Listeria seeligeri]MBF2671078.1 hypothetical protein [Listeria seeligeri]
MGIFENRSIVLDDNITNVEDWLTPEEAIHIFISAGYKLDLKDEYRHLIRTDDVISMYLRKITNSDSSELLGSYLYRMAQDNSRKRGFTQLVLDLDKEKDEYKSSKINKVDSRTLLSAT